MKQHKAYRIDSTALTVSEVTYGPLADLQNLVGGSIEVAFSWENGDTLYVDEEGLLKNPTRFFSVRAVRPDQPFAGNGVLVGAEVDDAGNTAPPEMTLDALRAIVRWVT